MTSLPSYTPLINRAVKRHKELRKWARRQGVTCYRIYDRDIPQFPLTIDLYELLPPVITSRAQAAAFPVFDNFMQEEWRRISCNDARIMAEIASRQYLVINSFFDDTKDLIDCSAIASALGIDSTHIITKRREHGKGGARYADFTADSVFDNFNDIMVRYTPPTGQEPPSHLLRRGDSPTIGTIYEEGLVFKVNLTERIDTGLFLDHRPMREFLAASCRGCRVLNLFCYTGSLSVAAAAGGATSVVSVDLSNTYLDWARDNMALNGFLDGVNYGSNDRSNERLNGRSNYSPLDGNIRFVKSDVSRFLDAALQRGDIYDLIILDPPTFSSSASAPMLDLNRDWPRLVEKCTKVLSPNGTLYFSTNSRRLRVADAPRGYGVEDITPRTIPPDFPLHKPHRCYKFTATATLL